MWHELSLNPQAITGLFGAPPPLERFDVFALTLGRDGPTFAVRGNLSTFPLVRPKRWPAEFNTVQATLEFFDLETVAITSWSAENLVDLSVRRDESSRIHCLGVGSATHFSVVAGFFRIAKLSGYQRAKSCAAATSSSSSCSVDSMPPASA